MDNEFAPDRNATIVGLKTRHTAKSIFVKTLHMADIRRTNARGAEYAVRPIGDNER